MTTTMNNRQRPIICGTDFSIHAVEAANVAAAIAKRVDSELVLVHVEEHAGLGASHPEVFSAVLERTRVHLAKEAERLRKLGAVVKAEILSGSAYEALVKAATASNARLVVVASIGQIALGRLLVGSVAERTAETSPVPTLVVRQDEPLVAWARRKRRLKVIVGCDFSASADAALRWLRDWQEIGHCEITVAHVDWPPADLERLGIRGPISLTEIHPEAARVLQRDLKERVAAIFGEQPVSLCVVPGWGHSDAQLTQLAQQEQADLLVVGTHQRHGLDRFWLGSVSRGVLRHASMSVAVVPLTGTSEGTLDRVPEIKRVLVTTDFSDLGNHAVPYAYAAVQRGSRIKLIHVIPPWELPGPLVPHYQPKRLTEKQHKQLTADSLKKLRSFIPSGAELRGIATEVEVVEHRDVAKAICQEAERFSADVICLGSHGRSGLSKAVLGSVAQKVMKQSSRPVLVVRPSKR
ncbi:MAG: universal stress protein [Verrucomicrobia bacterium]|nr:universal stress protein [Verrucomicrobiota bacterium]